MRSCLRVLIGVLFLLTGICGAEAQSRLHVDNSSLASAIDQAGKRNKVVAVVLRERVLGNSALYDDIFPFQADSLTILLLNSRFILSAPVGQTANDIRGRYSVPAGGYGILFINSEGILIDSISGTSYTEERLRTKAREALIQSGNIYFVEESNYTETLKSAAKLNSALVVQFSPNDANFKGILNGNFLNSELASALKKLDGLFAVQDESLVGEASPIYLFYNNGKLVHKIVGGVVWNCVADGVERSLSGRGLEAYKLRYAQGERSREFLEEFVELLGNAGDELCNEVAMLLLSECSDDALLRDRAAWHLYDEYVTKADERIFPLYVENRNNLAVLYGSDKVNEKLDKIWRSKLHGVLVQNSGLWSVDEASLKELRKSMSKAKVRDISTKILELRIECARRNSDYKLFSNLVNERWEIGGLDLKQLYEWCEWIESGSSDPDVRYRASRWLYVEAEKMRSYDRIHGTNLGSMRPYFDHLAVKLYGDN